MLTKLRTYPHSFYSSMKVKTFSTVVTPVAAVSIIALSIGLYCKCFWNKKSCVHKHTWLTTLPVNDTHIEFQPIMNPMPDISDHLSPQIIQEVLKASCLDFSKFRCYKQCKVQCHTSPQASKLHYIKTKKKEIFSFPFFSLHVYMYNSPLQLTTSHIWLCQSGTLNIY